MLELTAIFEFERLRFANVDGDTIIADARIIDGERITIKGVAAVGELQQHLSYRFYGHWTEYENKRTGKTEKQFAFKTFVQSQPHGRAGIITYLRKAGEGHNLGQATAIQIWERFGADAVQILREQPEVVATAIKRLSFESCQAVAKLLKEKQDLEDCTIEVTSLLDGRGFPKTTPGTAIRIWGNRAAEIIKRDPYQLMHFRGCGFKRCDSLYLELGLNPTRLRRQAFCAWYAIASNTEGHTWFSAQVAADGVRMMVGGAEEVNPKRAIQLATRICKLNKDTHGALAIIRESNGAIVEKGTGVYVAEGRKAWSEEQVAMAVSERLLEQPEFDSFWPSEIDDISEHQRSEILKCLQGSICILGGSPGTGKAQPLTSKVLTPSGWKAMGDIKAGSMVIGSNGHPTRVTAIHPQGEIEVFEVVFSDGSKTQCCNDHLWQTTSRKQRQSKKPSTAKPLSEIRTTLDRGDGSPNHKIPMVEKVEFTKTEVLIDPYVMGVLLGDGCLAPWNSVLLSNPESEIIEEVRRLLPPGCELRQRSGSIDYQFVDTVKHGTNRFLNAIREYSLDTLYSHEKFIPDEYLYSSSGFRESLLQGLLDTDGYTDGHNIEFTTTSQFLMKGMTEIVQSLGGTVTVSVKQEPKYKHKGEERIGRPAYRMIVKVPPSVKPFRVKRKLDKYIPKSKYIPSRYITEVNPIGKSQCQCISVESADGLYVTDDYIVTHNTYTAARVIYEIGKQFGFDAIAVAAPTGKAAVRITQAMQAYGLPLKARTWHSLLGVGETDSESGNWKFEHDENNPWPFQLIVGDESSMIDTNLMSSIIRATAKNCRLLLIGDVNQLPPVGHGAPLRDLIRAGVPYGELREIKRNSGGIVEACAAIRDGQPWQPSDNLILAGGDQLQSVLDELANAKKSGLDPVWDCQILVAVNEKSKLSRKVVNEFLQGELNQSVRVAGTPFRIGDKVVCLKNSDFPLIESDQEAQSSDEKTRVMNGELGKVVEIADKFLTIRIDDPYRLIRVPRGKSEGDDAGCNWDLGYALSCHKSQGSEWPVVIVLIDEYPGAKMVCDRSWVYTAISRARNRCVILGKKSTADAMCRRQTILKRKTFLCELILKNMAVLEMAGL